jgi:hypothetical protein
MSWLLPVRAARGVLVGRLGDDLEGAEDGEDSEDDVESEDRAPDGNIGPAAAQR